MARSSSLSRTAIWILLGLLIVGLAGFGATNLGGNIRTLGTVGDKSLTTQSYFLAMRNELARFQEQTGEPLTFSEAREIGLDRVVLQRLITLRALDHEASQMGLSVGDAQVRDQLLGIPAFQGIDGSFDREAYAFALERQGLTESEFETSIREETARTLLQRAVIDGISMPGTLTDTLVNHAAEERDFTWAPLGADLLEAPLPEPTEADLRAFHEANIARFQLPETKRITYAWVTPDMLADSVELDDAALREAYDERIEEFSRPERRLVERLVFLDDAAAEAAAAQLDVEGTTFAALVQERGLTLADIDMGDVDRMELGEAGEVVFAARQGEIVGPAPSPLGPALYRVNGILPAQSTSFEEALPELREELALQRARRVIDTQAGSYDDLLAGGATLEQLAAETDMELAEIDWSEESGAGIAAYERFRDAARALTVEDFPAIEGLEDGGVFAMRLDEALPRRPEPFESAREDVAEALQAQRRAEALAERGADLLAALRDGADFAELGLEAVVEEEQTRGAFIPDAPAELITAAFDMTPGDYRLVTGDGLVAILRLDEISTGAGRAEVQALRERVQEQLDQALAQDIFDIFTADVGLRAEPRIDQQAVEAVNANFP